MTGIDLDGSWSSCGSRPALMVVEALPVTSGAIALQMEGHPIEFREVWLEPLR